VKKTLVILAPSELANEIIRIGGQEMEAWQTHVLNEPEPLAEQFKNESIELLISFGTSVIVPAWILDKPKLQAVNLHAASPQYPGRDPHHFAVYENAARYGATLHCMTPEVDAGPIIGVEWFDVAAGITPATLLANANEAAFQLLEKHLPGLLKGNKAEPNPNLEWTGTKHSRKDFLDLCRIDPTMNEAEFLRRQRACQMPGYQNLYTNVYGKRFVLAELDDH